MHDLAARTARSCQILAFSVLRLPKHMSTRRRAARHRCATKTCRAPRTAALACRAEHQEAREGRVCHQEANNYPLASSRSSQRRGQVQGTTHRLWCVPNFLRSPRFYSRDSRNSSYSGIVEPAPRHLLQPCLPHIIHALFFFSHCIALSCEFISLRILHVSDCM